MKKESMIQNISDTALWVATYRAQESARPDALFKDPLASVLVGERGRQIAQHMSRSRTEDRIMGWVMVARTIAIDRLVLQAIHAGVDTVLNLGAGLDTRPYRLRLPAELRWVEVDFPHLIEFKNQTLQQEKPACRLERVSLDLSDRSGSQAFYARIGAEAKKVLVLTEGVILYLSNQDAAFLAEDLYAVPSFAFWIQDYYQGGLKKHTPRSWRRKLKATPFRFVTDQWFEFFSERGWTEVQTITTYDEAERIGRPFPAPFPFNWLMKVIPREKLQKMGPKTGYTRLKRK